MQPETGYGFVKRCSIATFSLCVIYASGMIQECITAEKTYNLFLYPSLLCIAAFFSMWGYTAQYKIPQDPLWYRHHETYMLVASVLICFGLSMLIVAIYPIYRIWSCAIILLWVIFIGNVNGAVTYIMNRRSKTKFT
ncbi:hypothetical protein LPMP_356700 [Leishmania panamensis]|uniref:Uncharacterized protein n=5 Tax=Viannia TaxID=37616 RepID=A4HQH4_LEIBR|nr:conserved hypothetical protein [Leishmania braziliensis MHOM/BR/75/M2904]XP_010703598.1 hypothetical protein LPMP_356700 [Leishmania panamensis]KAI5691707.1 hypothetical protein MNV84_08443 [Leishmania braziliensis]AIO02798.1 hypothetical protein LPMP_356700 [Leishmania panamensis]CAJ2482310.1 unnamed protein product [Leishmania braziliensis]CAM44440.1 conserved hypothetical protein [Leishmania braziliensis MHOM/BR/75/M2904]SYZ70519.1 hypothetical_protein [Leishmania braziliensis MHOM/BR/7